MGAYDHRTMLHKTNTSLFDPLYDYVVFYLRYTILYTFYPCVLVYFWLVSIILD